MGYGETKVYFDGSHYIAIPHTERKTKRRYKPPEEVITVTETPTAPTEESAVTNHVIAPISLAENPDGQIVTAKVETVPQQINDAPKQERRLTRKELFDELYSDSLNVKKSERRRKIITAMLPYFKSEKETAVYVDMNIQRKQRNLICRRIRLARKVNLQDFNFFVTFTYNSALHTEESFRRQLKCTLGHFSSRKRWKYVGVWERSPKKKRLHFHGLFHIPDGTMPGFMLETNDYNLNTHKRQITHQNTYFNDRFGRSDFETIKDKFTLGSAVAYIMKYLEKTGEKIVYSKGLPQYFISDIMDDDILCPFGMEDKKLLLYDDFRCWDEGVYMGNVSKGVIAKMRKSD